MPRYVFELLYIVPDKVIAKHFLPHKPANMKFYKIKVFPGSGSRNFQTAGQKSRFLAVIMLIKKLCFHGPWDFMASTDM